MTAATLARAVALIASLATAAIVALATAGAGTAQAHKTSDSRYTLIDLGTLGGPQAAIGNEPQFCPAACALTGNGAVVVTADTAVVDPYAPNDNPAFSGDPYVQHTFLWRNGVVTQLDSLGTQPGSNSSIPDDVNAQGDAVGLSDTGAIDPVLGVAAADAVLWKDGKVTDLGTLGGNESFALSLNNKDQVVGISSNTILDPFSMFGLGTQTRAFIWQHGVMRDLGTLGGPDAVAGAINDRGQVAGNAYTNSTPNPVTGVPTTDPFLWEKGKMRDLGTLGGTLGFANDMNSSGEVVGQSNLAGDLANHPFLWKQGSLIDLGTLGGATGAANAINDAGGVTGVATTSEEISPPAARQVYEAFLWKHGVMSDLGTTKGDRCSVGYSINNRSQVVGGAGICHGALDAFLWDKGSMMNLNDLIPPSATHLWLAFNINDQGDIVAVGHLPNGNQHEYLLVPNSPD
jgi:probable HAF family extracellular repeat protein